MDDLIDRLRPSLEAVLRAQDEDAWSRAEGKPTEGLAKWAAPHPLLFDPESLLALETLVASQEISASTRAVIRALQSTLLQLQLRKVSEPAERQAVLRDAVPSVTTIDARLSLSEALERMAHAANKEERSALQKSADAYLREHSQTERDRLEAWARVAQSLGATDLPALHQRLSGVDGAAMAGAAEEFLDQTHDAYEDVIGFLLRRSGLLSRAHRLSEASWHDLLHLRHAVGGAGLGDTGNLLEASEAWMTAWSWPGLTGRRVQRVLQSPLERGGSVAISASSAGHARLHLWMGKSWDAGTALMDALADLQQRLHEEADHPIEARRFVTPAIHEMYRGLFRRQREEALWLKRFASVQRDRVRDVARASAAMELLWLRIQAAQLRFERVVYARGAGPDANEAFVEHMQAAMGVRPPPAFFLRSIEPGFPSSDRLEGALLAAQLMQSLREQFDEEYFRNPEGGRWLARRWSRGARETPESLQRAIGIEQPASGGLSLRPLTDSILKTLSA